LGSLGKILTLERIIPGLYTASMKIPGEHIHVDAYFMRQNCPHISNAAKRYGKPVPNYPGLLMFIDERTSIPSHVVDYEVMRWKIQRGLPVDNNRHLRAIAACGAELYPDYFGAYPVPYITPWGYTTRHKMVVNGIFYLETDQCRRGLAIIFPIYDPLPDVTKEMAEHMDEPQPAYLFFQEKDACVPLFNLYNYISIEMGRKLPEAELKNAICKHHPDYAQQFNEALRSMRRPEKYYIIPDPDAGTDFFEFW